MKRFLTPLLAIIVSCWVPAYSQEQKLTAVQEAAQAVTEAIDKPQEQEEPVKPSYWTKSIQINLGASQTGLFNWAAGGYNTASFLTSLDLNFNYKKDLSSWSNRLQMEFGFLYSSDKPWPLIQKNNDRFYLESKWAHMTSATSKFKYSAAFDFRSQFASGYEYKTPAGENPSVDEWKAARILKSDFLSPAYTNLALGIEWTPTSWLDVNLSPATGGLTIVNNPELRQSYGMDKFDDGSGYRSAKFQFGAQLKTDIKLVINEKFKFETQLVLFTDYLHEPYIRVNWDNKIEWQFARLFKLGIYTWMIYDPWVMNGDQPRGLQFKENVALNFTYTFEPKLKHKKRHERPAGC